MRRQAFGPGEAIRQFFSTFLVTTLLGAGAVAAQEKPVHIVDVADLTGPAGTRWRNGVDLALREINARGGMLGRQVVITHGDLTQADTADLVLAAAHTVPLTELRVPVLAGSTLAGAPSAEPAQLAAHIAEALKARSVALIWSPGAEHRRYRDALLQQLVARRIGVASEIETEPQQVDFSAAVLRLREARADALVAILDNIEAPRLLRERHRQGYDKPIIGPASLIAPKVIEGIGPAANGARGIVGLSVDSPAPPIRDALRNYERAYGTKGDANALLAYSTVYVAKAIAERAGRLDAQSFAGAMKEIRLAAAEHPGVLLDLAFDESGAAQRGALVVEIRDGQPVVLDILTPARR